MSYTFNVGFGQNPKTLIASPGVISVQGPPPTLIGPPPSIQLTAGTGSYSLAGQPATLNGPSSFALQSLITGINNGAVFQDDTGGTNQPGQNQGTWMSDGTGNFARLNWALGGTAGLRWFGLDTAQTQLYISYDIRRTQNQDSKELKAFGRNYPTKFSNFTAGCNAGGYAGTRMGFSYSDDTVNGGDIGVQFFLDAFPTLTGGSAYVSTPHPIKQVAIGGNENITGTWQTIEHFYKQNTDGNADGEYAVWLNGGLIFWITGMINCYVGGQGFSRIDLGGYAPTAGTIEDYRNWLVSYSRPVGRGI